MRNLGRRGRAPLVALALGSAALAGQPCATPGAAELLRALDESLQSALQAEMNELATSALGAVAGRQPCLAVEATKLALERAPQLAEDLLTTACTEAQAFAPEIAAAAVEVLPGRELLVVEFASLGAPPHSDAIATAVAEAMRRAHRRVDRNRLALAARRGAAAGFAGPGYQGKQAYSTLPSSPEPAPLPLSNLELPPLWDPTQDAN